MLGSNPNPTQTTNMNEEQERLFNIVKQKYDRANTLSDKVSIKWLGWLIFFLHMDKGQRVRLACSEDEIIKTIEAITNDLYELRRESEARRKKIRRSIEVKGSRNHRRSA